MLKEFICDGVANNNQYSILYKIEYKNLVMLLEETASGKELSRQVYSKKSDREIKGKGIFWYNKKRVWRSK